VLERALFLCSATLAFWLIGCNRPPEKVEPGWAPTVTVASSIAGLGGAARLYKYQDTLVGVQVLHGGSAQLLILDRAKGSWFTTHVPGAPNDGGWLHLWGAAAIDLQSGRVALPGGYAEKDELIMKVFVGSLRHNGSLADLIERRWATDKKALFGETGPNVSLTGPPVKPDRPDRKGADLGIGLWRDSDLYIPFSFLGETYTPPNTWSNSPFCAGVFHSRDYGKSGELEKVSNFDAGMPAMCKTTGGYYYTGVRYPITRHGVWASRKPISGNTWEQPRMIAESFANVSGHFAVTGEDDTAHICWMDRRHNKWRFNLTGPPIENNDIYYRRRKDSDSEWGKEVWLSKGMLYCYAPTIAAEGDNVVVVWAGIGDAGKQHTDMGPNDIYYVTSKDGGATWTKPLKVTDRAKNGSTAGMPQVALLNGTIHLLHIQGSQRTPTEPSPGLTKLGNDPWPIYYTQRPFPK
jgi:hypothetical protein